MVNVGIIGFGVMGRIRNDCLLNNDKCRILAIAETEEYCDLPDVKIYKDPVQLIGDPHIDAVFICTPNFLNRPLTIRALVEGKHVFCEKPPAFSAKEMEEVIRAEQDSKGKKLMYGFNHRHHDSVIQAKKYIDSGIYGKVLWMRGRYGKSVDHRFFRNWRAKKECAGGGILMDQGIHMLDLFLMLGGDFDEVHAFISDLYWKLDVEDNVFAILRSQKGVVASLHSTMTQWRHLFSLEIFLEKGYIVINGLLTNSGTYGDEILSVAKNRTTAPAATWDDEEHFKFKVNNSWKYEVDHFLDSIVHDLPIRVGNSHDAHTLMTLVDKIYA